MAVSTVDDIGNGVGYDRDMRERRERTLAPGMLLAMAALLVMASTAVAASGLPATVSMDPASAEPGSEVEVTGLDFPSGQAIELQLTTTSGPVHLATVTTEEGGYFRQSVTLPTDVAPGPWELRAIAPNGMVAVHSLEAGTAPAAVHPADEAAGDPATETTGDPATESTVATATDQTTPRGNSAADIMVMLVFAVLIAAVGGAFVFAWKQTHGSTRQPGMGAGDDPIWSGVNFDT